MITPTPHGVIQQYFVLRECRCAWPTHNKESGSADLSTKFSPSTAVQERPRVGPSTDVLLAVIAPHFFEAHRTMHEHWGRALNMRARALPHGLLRYGFLRCWCCICSQRSIPAFGDAGTEFLQKTRCSSRRLRLRPCMTPRMYVPPGAVG